MKINLFVLVFLISIVNFKFFGSYNNNKIIKYNSFTVKKKFNSFCNGVFNCFKNESGEIILQFSVQQFFENNFSMHHSFDFKNDCYEESKKKAKFYKTEFILSVYELFKVIEKSLKEKFGPIQNFQYYEDSYEKLNVEEQYKSFLCKIVCHYLKYKKEYINFNESFDKEYKNFFKKAFFENFFERICTTYIKQYYSNLYLNQETKKKLMETNYLFLPYVMVFLNLFEFEFFKNSNSNLSDVFHKSIIKNYYGISLKKEKIQELSLQLRKFISLRYLFELCNKEQSEKQKEAQSQKMENNNFNPCVAIFNYYKEDSSKISIESFIQSNN